MTDDAASRASRDVYAQRMHRVVEHIDRHLDRPLELAELAAVAHFSPFHFHRLFSAWMGETFGEYLRRRRLEVAAARLLSQPRLPVLQVALSVGFGSGEAFTRAFAQRFGCPPTRWRAQQREAQARKHGQVDSKRDQAHPHAHRDDGDSPTRKETVMDVRLIDREPVTIACLRYVGPYGPALGTFWRDTVHPWLHTHGLLGRPAYGIGYDDPGITAPAQCRYDACVEVPEGFAAPSPARVTVLPGGRYAALDFHGAASDIGHAWNALLRDWLPDSGLQLDARPCFEHYAPDAADDAGGAFRCKICVPVAPL